MSNVMKGVHVLISGIVQGVNFRASTARKAKELSLTGWVRNLPDGRVEALFEGEEQNIRKILEWCRHGPPNAHVYDVTTEWHSYTGQYSDFSIEPSKLQRPWDEN